MRMCALLTIIINKIFYLLQLACAISIRSFLTDPSVRECLSTLTCYDTESLRAREIEKKIIAYNRQRKALKVGFLLQHVAVKSIAVLPDKSVCDFYFITLHQDDAKLSTTKCTSNIERLSIVAFIKIET
jgi:hypothetical protein